MAEVNAAIMAPLQSYNDWNIALTTVSPDNRAIFDDELASGTTYQLRAVNLLDKHTVKTSQTYSSLRACVSELDVWLTAVLAVKFGTPFARIIISSNVNAYHPQSIA
jgi:hypothetical protein